MVATFWFMIWNYIGVSVSQYKTYLHALILNQSQYIIHLVLFNPVLYTGHPYENTLPRADPGIIFGRRGHEG